jgi:hypothetical protein
MRGALKKTMLFRSLILDWRERKTAVRVKSFAIPVFFFGFARRAAGGSQVLTVVDITIHTAALIFLHVRSFNVIMRELKLTRQGSSARPDRATKRYGRAASSPA